tara:strand:- start:2877 stop:3152 length:276 start_codon:yes stop_codon:yes gene_type:complete
VATSKRNYKKEYAKFHKSKKSKTDRAARNKASRKKSCPSGKEVHHKDGNPRNNSKSNCVCVSVSKNRGRIEKSRKKGSKRNYPKKRKSRHA